MTDESTREAKQRAARVRWDKPGERERESAYQKSLWDDKRRQEQSEKMQAKLAADPELRAARSRAAQARWNKPGAEGRARTSMERAWARKWTLPEKEYPPIDLAYWAGIVDGEGCIRVHTSKGRTPTEPRRKPHARLTVAMQSEVVEQLGEFFGLKTNWQFYKKTDKLPMCVFAAQGTRAIAVLKLLLPYLRVKTVQAQEIIDQFK